MKSYASFIVGLAAFSFSGLASAKATYLDLYAQGDRQRARMDSGVEAVDSALPNSSVRVVESEEKVSKRGQFSVAVFNASGAPINFGTENVTVAVGNSPPMPTVTYERLVKEEKNRMMWAAVAAGLNAASNNIAASQAGYSSGTVAYSGATYGRYGTVNSYGTGSYSGYNAGAAYAAQATANTQNEQIFGRLAAESAASLQALKANLRTTTIDPGSSFGGLIMFDIPPKARKPAEPIPIRIIVEIAGEKHEMVGRLVRK